MTEMKLSDAFMQVSVSAATFSIKNGASGNLMQPRVLN